MVFFGEIFLVDVMRCVYAPGIRSLPEGMFVTFKCALTSSKDSIHWYPFLDLETHSIFVDILSNCAQDGEQSILEAPQAQLFKRSVICMINYQLK